MNQKVFNSLKIKIIILIAVFLVISLQITVLSLYERGEFYPLLDKIYQLGKKPDRELAVKETTDESDQETQERIRQLEEKIKELEEKQDVPFPNGSNVPLGKK